MTAPTWMYLSRVIITLEALLYFFLMSHFVFPYLASVTEEGHRIFGISRSLLFLVVVSFGSFSFPFASGPGKLIETFADAHYGTDDLPVGCYVAAGQISAKRTLPERLFPGLAKFDGVCIHPGEWISRARDLLLALPGPSEGRSPMRSQSVCRATRWWPP